MRADECCVFGGIRVMRLCSEARGSDKLTTCIPGNLRDGDGREREERGEGKGGQ